MSKQQIIFPRIVEVRGETKGINGAEGGGSGGYGPRVGRNDVWTTVN